MVDCKETNQRRRQAATSGKVTAANAASGFLSGIKSEILPNRQTDVYSAESAIENPTIGDPCRFV